MTPSSSSTHHMKDHSMHNIPSSSVLKSEGYYKSSSSSFSSMSSCSFSWMEIFHAEDTTLNGNHATDFISDRNVKKKEKNHTNNHLSWSQFECNGVYQHIIEKKEEEEDEEDDEEEDDKDKDDEDEDVDIKGTNNRNEAINNEKKVILTEEKDDSDKTVALYHKW
eukprot:CAMPEP_0114339960 /NCGR_PEP_ID=MMETSP0101-20121206/8067_1 /TAXON_ID=38822 ORGANISM="Pteridomonas danica, Strain PT" /NCGR_SAMPLE_ID=MMETSP0101 /ASSEMBLY_ACC=CAM_ASM_000211 /LENGTH=164 /DNA_ID=CAMNT_0001473081 /DNA_START=1287 /DNA_END=1778 /DNA_ORIENTATION=+